MLSQADPARSHYLPMNLKTKYPVIVRAEGRYLYAADGRAYLDGASGGVGAANPLSTAIGSAVLRYILDNDLVRRSATPETFRLSERCMRGCCIPAVAGAGNWRLL